MKSATSLKKPGQDLCQLVIYFIYERGEKHL